MATPSPTPTSKLPSKDDLVKKLESKAEEAKAKLTGKLGVNPFLWIKEVVNPLIKKIKEAPEVTETHVTEVASLELPKETVVPVTEVEPKPPTLRV